MRLELLQLTSLSYNYRVGINWAEIIDRMNQLSHNLTVEGSSQRQLSYNYCSVRFMTKVALLRVRRPNDHNY